MANHNCPSCNKKITYPHESLLQNFGNKAITNIREYLNLRNYEEWRCLNCSGYHSCVRCGKAITEELGLPFCEKHAIEEVINKKQNEASISKYEYTEHKSISFIERSFIFLVKVFFFLVGVVMCITSTSILVNSSRSEDAIFSIMIGLCGLALIGKVLGSFIFLVKVFFFLVGVVMCIISVGLLANSSTSENVIFSIMIGLCGLALIGKVLDLLD